MDFNPCIVIPVYNHGSTMQVTLEQLVPMQLACIVVDDGSDHDTKQVLLALAQQYSFVTLLTLTVNSGKGAAVIRGITAAQQLGYSHTVQVDADGQHNLADIPLLLDASQQRPEALVSGLPQYDDSIPKSRLYGRYITHFWVWIETLSFSVKDTMCGFRVYPVVATLQLLERNAVGLRMDFDTEIMVRLYWQSTPVIFIPSRIVYPETGISHFAVFRDNVRISWMHTRLVAGMLLRLPHLLAAKYKRSKGPQNSHWSDIRERGSYWGMAFSLWCYRLLGRGALIALLYPIISYFFISNRYTREQSQHFLQRVYLFTQSNNIEGYFRKEPSLFDSFQHFMNFGRSIVDRISAAVGDIKRNSLIFEQRGELLRFAREGRGCVIMTSHLGSTEMMRALFEQVPNVKMNVLVFSDHLERFNKLTKKLGVISSNIQLIQISTLDPGTAILLKEKIDNGEFVVVSSDRTPPSGSDRITYSMFLGEKAPFPQGTFILASLMECPAYLLFCLKIRNQYMVYFEKFSEKIVLPRKYREEKLQEYIDQYAQRLQFYCCKAPLQWFNFFDFWNDKKTKN